MRMIALSLEDLVRQVSRIEAKKRCFASASSTSVTPSVFEEHLQHLADGYNVISLEQAVTTLKAGELLPERAVVITFDDGYRNIYDNAHPLLLEYKMPYTVFVNPQLIGKHSYQLSWQQVAEMEKGGAQFANHTSHHRHLLERAEGESVAEWLVGIEQDILQLEHPTGQNRLNTFVEHSD